MWVSSSSLAETWRYRDIVAAPSSLATRLIDTAPRPSASGHPQPGVDDRRQAQAGPGAREAPCGDRPGRRHATATELGMSSATGLLPRLDEPREAYTIRIYAYAIRSAPSVDDAAAALLVVTAFVAFALPPYLTLRPGAVADPARRDRIPAITRCS